MTDAAVTAEDYDETSLPALWEAARWLMRWLLGVCGTPGALVAEPRLPARERRGILYWLLPVEAIVRRLLVAEAARIAKAPPPAGGRKRGNGKPRPARAPFCRVEFPDPEDSTGWAVRFAIFEPCVRDTAAAGREWPRVRGLDDDADILAPARLALSAAQHREARLASGAETPVPIPVMRPKPRRAAGNPWPLARRIEALIRVLANPAPHVRRLARRIQKDAARLQRTCRPPPERPPGERPSYGGETIRHASERALEALETFDTG